MAYRERNRHSSVVHDLLGSRCGKERQTKSKYTTHTAINIDVTVLIVKTKSPAAPCLDVVLLVHCFVLVCREGLPATHMLPYSGEQRTCFVSEQKHVTSNINQMISEHKHFRTETDISPTKKQMVSDQKHGIFKWNQVDPEQTQIISE